VSGFPSTGPLVGGTFTINGTPFVPREFVRDDGPEIVGTDGYGKPTYMGVRIIAYRLLNVQQGEFDTLYDLFKANRNNAVTLVFPDPRRHGANSTATCYLERPVIGGAGVLYDSVTVTFRDVRVGGEVF
jgi:hypothetical protein